MTRIDLPAVIVLLSAACALAAPEPASVIPHDLPITGTMRPSNELDEIVAIYSTEFENGMDGWTTRDLTDMGVQWHTNDFNAYQGGVSWWCGRPLVEGYENRWLQYLDTPMLDISNAGDELTLQFQVFLECEPPGGEPQDYDGWDGANVWVSTDGGESWQVLQHPILSLIHI